MNHDELLDQLGIQKLIYQYARSADELDVDGFADCFAVGGRITAPGYTGDLLSGNFAKAIIANLKLKYVSTMHNVHNHCYVIEGARATGVTYCVASHIERLEGQTAKFDMYIRYHDELVKEEGRWRFKERRFELLCTTQVPVQSVSQ
jgi:hypothetical protein